MEKIYSIDEIIKLAADIVKNPNDAEKYQEWPKAIFSASVKNLNEVVARLTSNKEYSPANIKALREAVKSTIEYKNSERIIETMTHLDRSANKLSNASFFLGIAGIVLAIIQVLQAFRIF
jgi:hypothetical protein